jgi:hypothetical protein
MLISIYILNQLKLDNESRYCCCHRNVIPSEIHDEILEIVIDMLNL